jgi:hypothetical protein
VSTHDVWSLHHRWSWLGEGDAMSQTDTYQAEEIDTDSEGDLDAAAD